MKRASIVDHKAIGLKLAALRRTHGLQASQAAAKAGVNTRSWRKWERGGPIQHIVVSENLPRLPLLR